MAGTRPVIRWAPVAVAAVLTLAVLSVVGVGRGDGDDPNRGDPASAGASPPTTAAPESVERVQSEIERRLAVPADPTDVAAAADALQWGIGRLLQAPAIEIDYSKQGTDPGAVTATAFVQPGQRSLDQQRTMTLEAGGVVTENRRVVDGIVYVRTDDELSPDLPAPWDQAPAADASENDIDRAFTAEGAAGTSLRGLPDRLRTVPFAATRAEAPDGSSTTYHLRAPTATGTPTVFDFTLGAGGVLTALSTYGAVVVDGEALEHAIVDIVYRPTASRPITAPPAGDLRH